MDAQAQILAWLEPRAGDPAWCTEECRNSSVFVHLKEQ